MHRQKALASMADGQTRERSTEKTWLGSIQIIGVRICPVLENETIVELNTEIAYSGSLSAL